MIVKRSFLSLFASITCGEGIKNRSLAQHGFGVSLLVLNDFDWEMGSHLKFHASAMGRE